MQETIFELKVGKLGFQPGQVATGDRGILLQNRHVVGALKSQQDVLLAFQIPLRALDLLRDGGQRVAGDDSADILFVL